MISDGEKYNLIVCSGGDGTLNETLSGIMEAGLDIPLGYIPAGSTNDFAARQDDLKHFSFVEV